jgi:hypothetical protein
LINVADDDKVDIDGNMILLFIVDEEDDAIFRLHNGDKIVARRIIIVLSWFKVLV